MPVYHGGGVIHGQRPAQPPSERPRSESPDANKMTLYYTDYRRTVMPIATSADASIDRLLDRIIETLLQQPISDVDRLHYRFYRVDIPAQTLDNTDLTGLDGCPRVMYCGLNVSTFWVKKPPVGRVHIFVKYNPQTQNVPEAVLDNGAKNEADFQREVKLARDAPAPSSAARVSTFIEEQEKRPIYIGRPKGCLPVGLFHPVFDQFCDSVGKEDAELLPAQLTAAHTLITKASSLYNSQNLRLAGIENPLKDLLGAQFVRLTTFRGSAADGVIYHPYGDLIRSSAPLLVMEVKNEIGEGHSDPTVQGCLSARAYLAEDRREALRDSSCCPHFVLGVAGPWVCVFGAIFGKEGYTAQALTDYIWLGSDFVTAQRLRRIARTFSALSQCIGDLKKYYSRLELRTHNNPDPDRFYPYTQTVDGAIIQCKSQLVEASQPKAIFKGRLNHEKDVVIKFTEQYNFDAHKLLAEHGFAPNLLLDSSSVKVAGLVPVVMEYVEGNTAWLRWRSGPFPGHIVSQIAGAMQLLHTGGYVFGDLRPPNIMVTPQNRVLLVDFDWCGRDGVDRYPETLNDSISMPWHPEVCRGGIMKKEHDQYLLKNLWAAAGGA